VIARDPSRLSPRDYERSSSSSSSPWTPANLTLCGLGLGLVADIVILLDLVGDLTG